MDPFPYLNPKYRLAATVTLFLKNIIISPTPPINASLVQKPFDFKERKPKSAHSTMATYKQRNPQDEQEDEGYSTESGGSDLDYDSDTDPSWSVFEETRSNLSRLSVKKKSKPRLV